jgi:protoporphyrinogen/coproporphyrinogen III oxidase
MSDSPGVYDLIVVGAGPSGLAYGLGAQGAAQRSGKPLRLKILDAADRPGGWVHTRSEGNYTLETGPYGYLDKHPELGQILERLGLRDQALYPASAAKNRYVLARGRLRRMPSGPLSFISSRILRPRDKLRLIREPWAAPHPGGDESVTDFATRRLGRAAAEALVVPMFTGIYAGDPDRASLASCFPRMAELERDHGGLFKALWRLRKQVRKSGQGVGAPRGELTSFSGGLSTLIDAFAEHFGAVLGLGTLVISVEPVDPEAGGGYRVMTGQGETLRAARVTLAAPARNLVEVVRPLDAELAGVLGEISYGGVSVVHTAYRRSDAHRVPEGFGFLVPRQAGLRLLGSVFVSTVYPEQAPTDQILLRNVLGGVMQPDLVEADDDRLLEIVAAEHRELLGVERAPCFAEVVHYPGCLPQYEVGHGELLARMEERVAGLEGLFVTGNAWRGIGLADCLAKNFAAGEAHFGDAG